MSLDLQRWRPYNVLKKMVIGWSGHPVNIPLLLDIESELKRLIAKYPHVELAVHCGKRPELSLPFRYVPYKPGFEQAFTQSLTVGLLPFSENEFTKGKSPIKALQYMACGVPVVGPAFGATKEIHSEAHGIVVQQGDWFAALSKAVEESQKMRFLGDQGRAFVERNHCMDKVGEQLVSIIKSSA
jgi:glycosyltransferase involved in cell wall biosynthesis